MENLAKWIDELTGEIEQLKKKLGTGGGSTVTITPTLASGIKVADFSVDDVDGVVNIPNMVGVCDYDNTVVPTTALSVQVDYTATEDCVFWLSVKNAANTDANIAINSKNAYGIYGPSMTQYMSFPLAKGDRITSSGLQFDQYTTYRVYKVKNTGVPVTTKRRKK